MIISKNKRPLVITKPFQINPNFIFSCLHPFFYFYLPQVTVKWSCIRIIVPFILWEHKFSGRPFYNCHKFYLSSQNLTLRELYWRIYYFFFSQHAYLFSRAHINLENLFLPQRACYESAPSTCSFKNLGFHSVFSHFFFLFCVLNSISSS